MNEMARVLTGKPILRGDENWRFGRGSAQDLALLPDGVGYVDQAELTALGADGEVAYTRQFAGSLSSPAGAPDGTLYVHDRSQLYAVAPDGATRWSRPVRSQVDPAAGDEGQVYVVDGGRLRGFSLEGRPLFDQRLQWFWQRKTYVEPSVGPEGKLMVADRDRHVRAFTADGQPLWSHKLSSGLVHGPVWGPDGSAAYTSLDNELVRLDPEGRETLRLKFEDELTCAPHLDARGNATVGDYFGALWRVEGDRPRPIGRFAGAPTALGEGPDGQLLVTTRWGGVHALGEGGWSEEVGGLGGPSLAAPDGIVYVNSLKSGLNALRTHRDPEAARAEEKRKARETFASLGEEEPQASIAEQGGYLLVGGVRVPRKQG